MTILDIDGNEVELAICKKITVKEKFDVYAELSDGSQVHLAKFFYEKSKDNYIRKLLKSLAAFRHVTFGGVKYVS